MFWPNNTTEHSRSYTNLAASPEAKNAVSKNCAYDVTKGEKSSRTNYRSYMSILTLHFGQLGWSLEFYDLFEDVALFFPIVYSANRKLARTINGSRSYELGSNESHYRSCGQRLSVQCTHCLRRTDWRWDIYDLLFKRNQHLCVWKTSSTWAMQKRSLRSSGMLKWFERLHMQSFKQIFHQIWRYSMFFPCYLVLSEHWL